MKINFNKFFKIVVSLGSVFETFAMSNPPPPNFKKPPPPPGLPIDENVLILALMALFFGIYIIFKQSIKKETSS